MIAFFSIFVNNHAQLFDKIIKFERFFFFLKACNLLIKQKNYKFD